MIFFVHDEARLNAVGPIAAAPGAERGGVVFHGTANIWEVRGRLAQDAARQANFAIDLSAHRPPAPADLALRLSLERPTVPAARRPSRTAWSAPAAWWRAVRRLRRGAGGCASPCPRSRPFRNSASSPDRQARGRRCAGWPSFSTRLLTRLARGVVMRGIATGVAPTDAEPRGGARGPARGVVIVRGVRDSLRKPADPRTRGCDCELRLRRAVQAAAARCADDARLRRRCAAPVR